MKYNLLSIIPYFGGDSTAAHSLKETRLEYLFKTYDSLINISDKIIISVCIPEDLEIVKTFNFNCEIYNMQGADPIFLPFFTVAHLQNKIEYEYIYYTEADQILYVKDKDKIFNQLDKNVYIVPQRLEKIYNGVGANRGENVRFKDSTYAVINKTGNSRPYEQAPEFYVNVTKEDAFGGCFLCHRDLFNRVQFNMSNSLPIEHTSGFDMFNTPGALCLKTNNIYDFFTDHLSGYEYHKKLAGVV